MGETNKADERRVVRDVAPSLVRDLLERPPRGTVAFVEDGEVNVVPVRVRCSVGAYSFAVLGRSAAGLDGSEVVLVVDDGPYWFELRGVSVRGVARRAAPPGHDGRLLWYDIEPRRVLAWDYGALRET